MMKKTEIVFLVAIMLIATFFRVYRITQTPPGLYPDEAMDGNSGLKALATHDFKVFYSENNGREGLYANLDALLFAVLGPSKPSATTEGVPWILRLPSVIAGILTVLALYFLAKELFSKEVGLLASFLLAVNFWHINFSRIGFRAILAPFFLAWALYFLIRTLKNDFPPQLSQNKSWEGENSKGWFFAIVGGVMYGLGFYTYIAYRVSPLLLLFVIIHFYRKSRGEIRKKIIFSTFSFLLSAFVVALPIGLYFLHNPADFTGRTSEISIFKGSSPLTAFLKNTASTLAMFNVKGDGNERHNYMGQPELEFLVGIFFIIGIISSIKKLVIRSSKEKSNLPASPKSQRDERFALWLIFVWFVLAILPVAISNEGIPHALRSILMIPPVIILAALGGISMYAFFGTWLAVRSRKILSLFVFALLIFQTYITYFVLWANSQRTQDAFAMNYVAIADRINALPAGIPKYVIVQTAGVSVPITMSSGKVKEIPMPAQTVMFITDTYMASGQSAKNVTYLLPDETSQIPSGTPPDQIFTIK